MEDLWNPMEKQAVQSRLREAITGSPETVDRKLAAFLDRTGVQEIFAVTDTYHQSDRLRSYELLADIAAAPAANPPAMAEYAY
jgi:alkanesulfonate monooxygenase SsuD/methylene tetrahydromethanopterin reductase-like flavin-dependent oxidoreductase (luciferase family)